MHNGRLSSHLHSFCLFLAYCSLDILFYVSQFPNANACKWHGGTSLTYAYFEVKETIAHMKVITKHVTRSVKHAGIFFSVGTCKKGGSNRKKDSSMFYTSSFS